MPVFSLPELQRKAAVIRTHESALFKKTASQVLTESSLSFSEKPGYDVFLSHSFRDAHFILALKMDLEGMNYSVYVDWLVDSQLDRSKVSKDTADLLRRRMKSCRSLFIVHSENSQASKWVPWELGFFDGMKGRVAVLPIVNTEFPDDRYYGVEYMALYPYVTKAKNQATNKETLWIHDSENYYVHFDAWLGGNAPIYHERYTR